MLEAAFWGAVAASTLLIGAFVAYMLAPSKRLVAIVMALGSGLLIGSVAYDLVEDAQISIGTPLIGASLIAGAAVFVAGSRAIDARSKRKQGASASDDNPLGIVMGSALDGIPESFVLGLSVLHGGVSAPLLIGIGLSNLPEGMAASAGMRERGWPLRRTASLWLTVVVTSAIAAAVGHQVLASDDGTLTGMVQTFAAGALLAMITDTMIPESYEVERSWTGGLVVLGFALSLVIASVLG